MKIGILANEGSWYFRDLQRAANDRRHECVRLDFERIVAQVGRHGLAINPASPVTTTSHALNRFDVVIVRTMPPGSLEQVVYRMDVLAQWQLAGTRVVNSPKSLECAVDKFLTTARLQQAGLPVPETIVCEHEDDAMQAFEQLGRDVVVKPLFGAEGRGIVRVSDPDLAHRTFRTLMRLDTVLYLQRFVDHGGKDLRIFVLNQRVVGAMTRHSPHDFRTNVARDGIAEAYSPTDLEAELALKASDVTGTYVAGIDLLYDSFGNAYVIEVNAVPGWQAFGRVNRIDVADRLLNELSQS